MSKILIILSVYLINSTSYALSVNPSQASEEAIEVASKEVRFELGWGTKTLEANVIQGEFVEGVSSNYFVELLALNSNTDELYKCDSHVVVDARPFAKRRRTEVILDQVINGTQVIGVVANLECSLVLL